MTPPSSAVGNLADEMRDCTCGHVPDEHKPIRTGLGECTVAIIFLEMINGSLFPNAQACPCFAFEENPSGGDL